MTDNLEGNIEIPMEAQEQQGDAQRPQAGRLRSQWLPHPKKPRYKVTFPLRKVTFIFIDQSFALLTYDFQYFFVTLQLKY